MLSAPGYRANNNNNNNMAPNAGWLGQDQMQGLQQQQGQQMGAVRWNVCVYIRKKSMCLFFGDRVEGNEGMGSPLRVQCFAHESV